MKLIIQETEEKFNIDDGSMIAENPFIMKREPFLYEETL